MTAKSHRVLFMLLNKKNNFDDFGYMIDCSRGAVPTIESLKKLVDMLYERNDMDLVRGTFRSKGDTIEVLSKLPDKCVNMIFADPPYFMQSSDKILQRADGTGEFSGCDDSWDKFEDYQDYDSFCIKWLKECKRILKDNGTIWVIGSFQNIYRLGYIMQNLGFWFLNDIIWNKICVSNEIKDAINKNNFNNGIGWVPGIYMVGSVNIIDDDGESVLYLLSKEVVCTTVHTTCKYSDIYANFKNDGHKLPNRHAKRQENVNMSCQRADS